jgi:dTDP-4-dehydrorhamnose reductase
MRDKIIVIGNNYVGSSFANANYVTEVWDQDKLIENPEWINLFSDVSVIINCVDNKEIDIRKNWRDNYEVVYNLNDHCKKYGIKLVHISTADLYGNVWDWASTEESVCNNFDTNNDYRLSKRVAERILANNDNCIIMRIKNPFDGRVHMDNALIHPLYEEKLYCWQNAYTYLPDFVKFLGILLEKNETGIFNMVQIRICSIQYFYTQLLTLPRYVHIDGHELNNPLMINETSIDRIHGDVHSLKIQQHGITTDLDAAVLISWANIAKTLDSNLYNGNIPYGTTIPHAPNTD